MIRRNAVLFALTGLIVLAMAAGACEVGNSQPQGAKLSPAPTRALSTAVKIAPGSKPGSYLATVEVSDADSHELLMAPRVYFPKGDEPTVASGTLPNGDEIIFSVAVDEAGTTASYTAELKRSGASVNLQKASVNIGR